MQSHKFNFIRRALSGISSLMLCADFCSLALAQGTDGYSNLGFGNVHVNFETPSGYMSGFRDYLNFVSGASTGTQIGPVAYVGNYGGVSEPDTDGDSSINFIRLTDDIDENGVFGAAVIVTIGPNGEPLITTLTDFDDLHTFNIAFDEIGIALQRGYQTSDVGGVLWVYEEEGTYRNAEQVSAEQAEDAITSIALDASTIRRGTGSRVVGVRARVPSRFVPQFSKYAEGRRGGGVGITYGYSEFNLFDRFYFEGNGGILGRTYSDTRSENWVTGPQAGLVALKSFGPLTLYAHGVAVAGINDVEMMQTNGIGTEMIPGAVNRPLYAQPTYSENAATSDEFTPAGMLWAEAGLQITKNSTIRVAWSGIFVDNVALSQDRVRYYLPDMGFRDPGNQHFIQQLFFCGIEVVR
jgi:hypothetical protein